VLVVSLLNLGLKLGEKPVTETLLLTTTERATETSTAVLTSTKLTVETVTQKELTTIVAPPTTVTLTSTRYETVTTTTTLPPLTITMTATAPPVTVTTTATQYITRILITTTTTTATTTLPAGPFTYAEKVRLSGVTVEDAGSGYYNIRGRATNISNQTISNLYIFAFVYDETGKLTNDPRWQNAKLEDMLPGDTMTFKISLVNIEKGWRLELLAVA
jgi:hypothetical protein